MNKGQLISRAAKMRKENSKVFSELVIEGNRLFLTSRGHGPIQVKIDATPLWHFFKECQQWNDTRSTTVKKVTSRQNKGDQS